MLKDLFNLSSDYEYSGLDAIRLIQSKALQDKPQYKLIFMDLNMPGLNGQETTKIIRQFADDPIYSLQDTKIILFSCLSNTADLPTLRLQFDGVANKPTDYNNLKSLLIHYGLIEPSIF